MQGVKVIANFDNMSLKEELLRGLYAYGFEKPSAIQQRAVIPIIQGRDVIAQASWDDLACSWHCSPPAPCPAQGICLEA